MVEPPFSETEIRRYWESRLPGLTQQRTNEKGEWRLPCPLHGGERKSFSINPRTGRYFCHSKCASGGDILAYEQKKYGGDFPTVKARAFEAIGRSEDPKKPERKMAGSDDTRQAERYEFVDEAGRVQHIEERFYRPGDREKNFRQGRPDGKGGVIWNLQGVKPLPYRFPQLLRAETICFAEGPKDCHTLEAWDYVASTNAGGAGQAKLYCDWAKCGYFNGKHFINVFDNDRPGKEHLLARAEALLPVAASVKIIELPGLADKEDITDWVEKYGGTREQFKEFVNAAKPLDKSALVSLRARWGLAGSAEPPVPVMVEAREWPEVGGVNWPENLGEDAFHGLVGEVVRTIEPHTESDVAAILIQFLVVFGNLIGRSAYFRAEADKHYTNLYAVLVGQTAKGRKGTSFGQVRNLVNGLDPNWSEHRQMSGLSSGEGLIWTVRDEKRENVAIRDKGRTVGYEEAVTDHGEKEKRVLVIEPEFARVLQATERESNTLSAIVRQAWDTGNLRILTKKESARATDAHISIIGHITSTELKRELTDTAMGNGFANRFLWCCTQRSKLLPEGGALHAVDLSPIVEKLRRAAEFARGVGEIRRDERARVMWCAVYAALSEGKPGLLGSVTSRAEAQTMRLACIYALLDCSEVVTTEHLSAALEVWRYCEDSARFIFGDALGDAVADEILRELRQRPKGMTRSEIRDHFGRNKKSEEIARALESLRANGLAKGDKEREDDQQKKPTERWLSIR